MDRIRTTKLLINPLASKVLAVAVLNFEKGSLFDWVCCVDTVEGNNHTKEAETVVQRGTKQCKEYARLFFPQIPIEKYRE